MNTLKTLRRLTETPGPSGNEAAIGDEIVKLWSPLVDEIERDRLGNVIGVKRGQATENGRFRILLAAHMDEIGLMVREIVGHNGNGFLRVTPLGGIDRRHVYGQLVDIHATGDGAQTLTAVIGAPPLNRLPANRRAKAFLYDDLFLDPGLPLPDVKQRIAVGDFVTFRQSLHKLLGQRAAGKALDNRASVAAVTVALDRLQKERHDWDVVVVATVQEETRLLGAHTTAFALQPDIALAIDVTFAKGPGSSSSSNWRLFELGGGPAIGLGPNVHLGVLKGLQATARNLEMKVEIDPHSRHSGTDAGGLQIARAGVPTGVVGIPLRYMHTPVETVALKDIERAGRLLAAYIASLDDESLSQLSQALHPEKAPE